MSASGVGPFENDLAMDFCDELQDLDAERVLAALRTALRAAVDTPAGEYLDREVGEPAVAAAAIAIARAQQRVGVLEDVELEAAVPEIPKDLVRLAIAAIERTVRPDSEIRRLWERAGYLSEWTQTLESLVADAMRHI